MFKKLTYINNGSIIHSNEVPGHNHAVVVAWFVPSCYSDSASSAHIHGFYEVRMHRYVHPLHQNVLKHFIYILDGSLSHSDMVPGHNHVPCDSNIVCTKLLLRISQLNPPSCFYEVRRTIHCIRRCLNT